MVGLLRLGSAAAMALVILVGAVLYERQLHWTIERNAAMSATAWLAYFPSTEPDFEPLLQTRAASDTQIEALETAKAALGFFRFKPFSAEGGHFRGAAVDRSRPVQAVQRQLRA